MKLRYRVLVLEDDPHALAGVVELLSESGCDVVPTSAYDDAKNQLARGAFDVFITDVHVRSFNGLHLVMKVRKESPETAIVIMTGYDEPLLELEAGRYSAVLIKKPITATVLFDAVRRSIRTARRQRRWPRTRVAGGFRVTAAGRPAAVVDVSYGGLCLQIPNTGPLPSSFDVEVSGIGLHLVVEPVWSSTAAAGAVLCGAALSPDTTAAVHTWREIVDRLSA